MIENKGGIWWPRLDVHCRIACTSAQEDVKNIIQYCSKRNTVVQAGGNVGIWPLELSKYFTSVVTLEPDPENYECLLKNTSDNPRIKSYNAGLSDKYEWVDLYREFDNCGAHYVRGEGEIELFTLDGMNLGSCDLIALDIEGYEYKALVGAVKTIEKYHPSIVCEEKGLGKLHGIDKNAIAGMLSELGYKMRDKIGNDAIYTL